MEQSVESNSFEKFKAIASLPIAWYFAHISEIFCKKGFSENPVNLDIRI